MKKIYLFVTVLVCVLILSTNTRVIDDSFLKGSPKPYVKPILHIVALGDVNDSDILFIKKSVESFYPEITCVIDKKEELTSDILASSGTRYEASKIITKYNSDKNILLITNVDIAYHNKVRNIKEYGIIGYAFRPGKTCVVSTFRIKRNGKAKLMDRLEKVVLHEIGHNLNIPHCENDKECLMHAADGTVTQIDRERVWICDMCRKKIKPLT
jgi:archaemetzincin